jgi:hypothetical protein
MTDMKSSYLKKTLSIDSRSNIVEKSNWAKKDNILVSQLKDAVNKYSDSKSVDNIFKCVYELAAYTDFYEIYESYANEIKSDPDSFLLNKKYSNIVPKNNNEYYIKKFDEYKRKEVSNVYDYAKTNSTPLLLGTGLGSALRPQAIGESDEDYQNYLMCVDENFKSYS